MPVSPSMAEDLAAAVADLYEAAQGTIITRIRDALAAGINSPVWLQLKAAAVGDLQTAIQAVIDALAYDAGGAIRQAVATAYERGQQAAVAELGALTVGRQVAVVAALPNAPAVDRLASALISDTGPVHVRMLRQTMDVYRGVITHASAAPLLGAQTRRQAAQTALDQFAQRGVTGFVDRAGRGWDMRSYVEMATRSVVGRAAVDAHTDRLTAAGVDLVMVSDSPEECPLCRPWEGKILALTGAPGARTIEQEHTTDDDRTVRVDVAGTLAEARAAGLQHPNCTHRTSAYLPGVTTPPATVPARATYEQSQQQRYYERQIRRWKREAAGAMDDAKRMKANASVRAYQAKIRALVNETGLPRKSHREQMSTAR